MTNEDLTADEWTDVQNDLRAHLDEFRSEYEDTANNNEKVKETDDYVIFADGSGHELNEIAEIVGVDVRALSQRMHDEARKRYSGEGSGDPWSYRDPVVVLKSHTVDADEIDSTFQQVDDPDMPRWEGTHTYGNYSVTREFLLDTHGLVVSVLTKYEYDGRELNRYEDEWDVSRREDVDDMTPEVERFTVDHSGELPAPFAENNHYADPQADIEFAMGANDD
jgi:hypothetical protein